MHPTRFWIFPVAVLAMLTSWTPGRAEQPHCVIIYVDTQDTNGAGTDANITATVTDQNGNQASWVLNPEMPGNAFERGATDYATYCTADARFGTPKSLSLYSDGYGPGSAWDVARVSVRTRYSITVSPLPKQAAMVVFPFYTTLDDEQTIRNDRGTLNLLDCPGC